jgi:hypothetical protein
LVEVVAGRARVGGRNERVDGHGEQQEQDPVKNNNKKGTTEDQQQGR